MNGADKGNEDRKLAAVYQKVRRLVFRMLGSQEGTEDVVQTAMETFLKARKDHRGDGSLEAFAQGIAVNVVRGFMRKQRRGIMLRELVARQEAWPELPPDPSDQADSREKLRNVEEALRLIETKGKGAGGAAFHVLAGDVYRKAGRWAEAAEAYMTAAEKGSHKQAERALLRAAEIQLRKLGKPAEAASVIDGYLKKFPTGKHLDEALYLGGVANMKSGKQNNARTMLERYLAAFPSGPKSAGVHLMLAKILAVKMSNCAGAAPHIKAVLKKAPGSGMAAEAEKIAAGCAKIRSHHEEHSCTAYRNWHHFVWVRV